MSCDINVWRRRLAERLAAASEETAVVDGDSEVDASTADGEGRRTADGHR